MAPLGRATLARTDDGIVSPRTAFPDGASPTTAAGGATSPAETPKPTWPLVGVHGKVKPANAARLVLPGPSETSDEVEIPASGVRRAGSGGGVGGGAGPGRDASQAGSVSSHPISFFEQSTSPPADSSGESVGAVASRAVDRPGGAVAGPASPFERAPARPQRRPTHPPSPPSTPTFPPPSTTPWCPTTLAAHAIELSRFRLVRLIGEGSGASSVFEARCERSGLVVALRAHPRESLSPLAAARARREARVRARVSHPNVCPLYASWEDGEGAYAISRLEDGSLETLLASRGGILTEKEVRDAIARPLLEALEHLHAKGIVHRGIRPAAALVRTAPDDSARGTESAAGGGIGSRADGTDGDARGRWDGAGGRDANRRYRACNGGANRVDGSSGAAATSRGPSVASAAFAGVWTERGTTTSGRAALCDPTRPAAGPVPFRCVLAGFSVAIDTTTDAVRSPAGALDYLAPEIAALLTRDRTAKVGTDGEQLLERSARRSSSTGLASSCTQAAGEGDGGCVSERGAEKRDGGGASERELAGDAAARELDAAPFDGAAPSPLALARRDRRAGPAGDHLYGPAVDVFSLGCLVYECLVGSPPFEARTADATVTNVKRATPQIPRHLSKWAREFLSAALEKDPARRPTAAQLLAGSWLAAGRARANRTKRAGGDGSTCSVGAAGSPSVASSSPSSLAFAGAPRLGAAPPGALAAVSLPGISAAGSGAGSGPLATDEPLPSPRLALDLTALAPSPTSAASASGPFETFGFPSARRSAPRDVPISRPSHRSRAVEIRPASIGASSGVTAAATVPAQLPGAGRGAPDAGATRVEVGDVAVHVSLIYTRGADGRSESSSRALESEGSADGHVFGLDRGFSDGTTGEIGVTGGTAPSAAPWSALGVGLSGRSESAGNNEGNRTVGDGAAAGAAAAGGSLRLPPAVTTRSAARNRSDSSDHADDADAFDAFGAFDDDHFDGSGVFGSGGDGSGGVAFGGGAEGDRGVALGGGAEAGGEAAFGIGSDGRAPYGILSPAASLVKRSRGLRGVKCEGGAESDAFDSPLGDSSLPTLQRAEGDSLERAVSVDASPSIPAEERHLTVASPSSPSDGLGAATSAVEGPSPPPIALASSGTLPSEVWWTLERSPNGALRPPRGVSSSDASSDDER